MLTCQWALCHDFLLKGYYCCTRECLCSGTLKRGGKTYARYRDCLWEMVRVGRGVLDVRLGLSVKRMDFGVFAPVDSSPA